jgi:phosphatidylglycerol:prolipoprotein diacylglycerol transferase
MLPYFEIFGRVVPMYGVCFVIGMGLAVLTAWLLARRFKEVPQIDVTCSAVYTGIGAVVGAKLLFIIVNLPLIISGQLTLLQAFQGGFVFYGGLIGGVIGLFIYVKHYKLNAFKFFELYATIVPLGHSIGRVGCFFGGCCYGIEYDGPLSVTYDMTIGNTPVGIPLFPVQLVEAALLLCLFFVVLFLYIKKRHLGIQVLTYGFVYCLLRFSLEFLRGDKERGALLGMSTSQFISLIFAAVLIAIIIVRVKKSKKQVTK